MEMLKAHGFIVGTMGAVGVVTYGITVNPAAALLGACLGGIAASFAVLYAGLRGWL